MIRWFIDKSSRVPLYLQLKDLVQYYISTGALADKQQLPTVSKLASEVGITFETVRKTYKELERDGLVASTRGRGTFVNGHATSKQNLVSLREHKVDLARSLKTSVEQWLDEGNDPANVARLFQKALREAVSERPRRVIVFTECNELQVRTISKTLRESLQVPIKPVLLEKLREEIRRSSLHSVEPAAVVTTGFHLREVRQMLADTRIPVDFVITRMSPQTRRALDAFDKNARFGFLCRDKASVPLYKDLLKSELDLRSDLASCALSEPEALRPLLNSLDVLMVSPPVYEQVKKIAPAKLHIFNVFDWVDPLSLQGIRDRLSPSETSQSQGGLTHG